MSRRKEYEAELAKSIRYIYRGQDVLYHGTRYLGDILRTGELRCERRLNWPTLSFSRAPEPAARWALLSRDDETGAGILILNRKTLRARYPLEPYHDQPFYGPPGLGVPDEMEEMLWDRDVTDLRRHLVGTFILLRDPPLPTLEQIRQRIKAENAASLPP